MSKRIIKNYRSMKLSAKSLRKKSKRIKILEELSRVDRAFKIGKTDRDLIPAIQAGENEMSAKPYERNQNE